MTIENIEKRFQSLRQWIKNDLTYLRKVRKARSDEFLDHPGYAEVVQLGPDVLPLIFENLMVDNVIWFDVLRSMTGTDPVRPENKKKKLDSARDWIIWWQNKEKKSRKDKEESTVT